MCHDDFQPLTRRILKFQQHWGFNADGIFDADFFAEFASDAVLGFDEFANSEETFGMFACLGVLQFEAFPRADVDAEVASGAELFVNNGDRPVRRAANEFAHFAELIADCLDRANHPARAAIDTNARIYDVQHIPVSRNRVNRAVGKARHAPDTFISDIVGHQFFTSDSILPQTLWIFKVCFQFQERIVFSPP